MAGLLCGFVLVNLLTADRCPAVWHDDGAYTEPAGNLYLGRGFTSANWYAQGKDEFWAGNVPLHQGVLYLWMQGFGFSLVSVRALNCVLMAAAAGVLWLAAGRLRLVAAGRYRILMVVLVLCGFSVCLSYRSGRPDCICILLASAAALAFSIGSRAVRLGVLGVLGVLFPIAGLQLVVFAGVLCLLLVCFLKMRYLPEMTAGALGCVVGGLLLAALYCYHGVSSEFLASTIGKHSSLGDAGLAYKLAAWRGRLGGITLAASFHLVLLTVLLIAAWTARKGRFVWRSPLGFGVAAGLAIPAGVAAAGVYPLYYGWMGYIPVCVCLCSALDARGAALPAVLRRRVVPALLGLACLAGLPLVLLLTVVEWKDRDYRLVENLVREHVRRSDCVYHDGAAFFALQTQVPAAMGYLYLRAMTPEEKQQVSVMVIRPERFAATSRSLGGRWRPCGEPLVPSRGPLLGLDTDFFFRKHRLQVYRREPDVASVRKDATDHRPS